MTVRVFAMWIRRETLMDSREILTEKLNLNCRSMLLIRNLETKFSTTSYAPRPTF
jgi:hypothetical protein